MSGELVFNITGGGPYGMTIKGGLEFGSPVTIDKTKETSKAYIAGLREGDVILSINGTDVTRVTHETAKNCIVQAKSTMEIKVKRGDSPRGSESPKTESKPTITPAQKPVASTNQTSSTQGSQTNLSTQSQSKSSYLTNPPPKANIVVTGNTNELNDLKSKDNQKLETVGSKIAATSTVGVCVQCGSSITSQKYLKLGSRVWHTDHFNCNSCSKNISSIGFFEDKDKVYCKECYGDLFSAKCAKCGKACVDSYLTTNDRSYHSSCFNCHKCNSPLAGKPLNFHENQPHCMDCYSDIMSIKCDGCNKPIRPNEGYLEVKNKQYHESCFRCSICNEELASKGRYLIQNGRPICPTHN